MPDRQRPIHDIVRQLERAWNDGDSQHYAVVFAADADFINILGMHYKGRSTIEAGHREIFDTIYKDSRSNYSVEDIRLLGEDVAIACGDKFWRSPGTSMGLWQITERRWRCFPRSVLPIRMMLTPGSTSPLPTRRSQTCWS